MVYMVMCFTMDTMSFNASSNRSFGGPGAVCIPNVLLKSLLTDSNDRLNVAHVNAGSIFPKIDELLWILSRRLKPALRAIAQINR